MLISMFLLLRSPVSAVPLHRAFEGVGTQVVHTALRQPHLHPFLGNFCIILLLAPILLAPLFGAEIHVAESELRMIPHFSMPPIFSMFLYRICEERFDRDCAVC